MESASIRLQMPQIIFRYVRGFYDQKEIEFHTRHELFFLFSGNAELISEHGRQPIAPRTAVILPKETLHCFLYHGPEKNYVRCVFKLDDVAEWQSLIAKKFDRLRLVQSPAITRIFSKLQTLASEDRPEDEKRILIKAFLAQILVEIDATSSPNTDAANPLSSLTRGTLQAIGRRLAEPLTLSDIAQELHVSPSHLSHQFKAEMQISIHRFILNQRLLMASHALQRGTPATRVATECGFGDYSNFYTQFKKRFGRSPSHPATDPE